VITKLVADELDVGGDSGPHRASGAGVGQREGKTDHHPDQD
jgi:hypothetical protein